MASADSTSRRGPTMWCSSHRARASASQRRAVSIRPASSAQRPCWWREPHERVGRRRRGRRLVRRGGQRGRLLQPAALGQGVDLVEDVHARARGWRPGRGAACARRTRVPASSTPVSHRPVATSAGTSARARRARCRGRSRSPSRVEDGERVDRPAGVGEEHRLVQRELLGRPAGRRAGGGPRAFTSSASSWRQQSPHQVAGPHLGDAAPGARRRRPRTPPRR